MSDALAGEGRAPHFPAAVFMGDFNVGKSSLINALLRRETLPATREESRALPTFVARSILREPRYAALRRNGDLDAKAHEEFVEIRKDSEHGAAYSSLGAALPGAPFARLVLVDTAGASSDWIQSIRLPRIDGQEQTLFVAVADIEYWSAKHTLEFIAHHHELYGGALVVVANKADHLNAVEIRRIREKAAGRMERFGMSPPPRFFALSARLESARGLPHSEYRRRIKPEVRELCDMDFDAFRVALYEFEARHSEESSCHSFRQLLQSAAPSAFVQALEDSVQ